MDDDECFEDCLVGESKRWGFLGHRGWAHYRPGAIPQPIVEGSKDFGNARLAGVGRNKDVFDILGLWCCKLVFGGALLLVSVGPRERVEEG